MKKAYYAFAILFLLTGSQLVIASGPKKPLEIQIKKLPDILNNTDGIVEIIARENFNTVKITVQCDDKLLSLEKEKLIYGLKKDETITFPFSAKLKTQPADIAEITISIYAETPDGFLLYDTDMIYLLLDNGSVRILRLTDLVSERGVGTIEPIPELPQGSVILASEQIFSVVEPTEPDSAYFNDDNQGELDNKSWENIESGSIYVMGYLFYQDPDDNSGTYRPAVNVSVEVWDDDNTSFEDHLATGITNSSGYFYIGPIENDDCWGCGTIDLFLRFRLNNSRFMVVDFSGNSYWWTTGIQSNVGNGNHDFGQLVLIGGPYGGAIPIFQFMNRAWNYAKNTGGKDPGKIAAFFPSSSSYANSSKGSIYIAGDDWDSHDTVVHEYAHAMMGKAYSGWWPSNATPNPHYINKASTTNAGWTEGWADFYPLAVLPDGRYHFNSSNSGPSANIENTSWMDSGPAVEGRVAGALLDLIDSSNDGLDQNSSDRVSFRTLWRDAMWGNRDSNFAEFWQTLEPKLTCTQSQKGEKSVENNTINVTGCTALSVAISGPSSAPCATGTWDASATGGRPGYTYEWYHKWECSGGGGPPEVPCDEWNSVGSNSSTMQMYLCGGNSVIRVDVTDSDGNTTSDEYYVNGAAKIKSEQVSVSNPIPVKFSLFQNHPNPFNPETTIQFALPNAEKVQLIIFDMLGREVRRVIDEEMRAGYHSIIWNGVDNKGDKVASGVYIYKIIAGEFVAYKKLTLLQ